MKTYCELFIWINLMPHEKSLMEPSLIQKLFILIHICEVENSQFSDCPPLRPCVRFSHTRFPDITRFVRNINNYKTIEPHFLNIIFYSKLVDY